MKTCKKENCEYPVFSHGYCRNHQYCRQDQNRPSISTSINEAKQRHIKPKKGVTGELALFKEIWSERKHVSEISGKSIPVFDPKSFHHILTKGAFPSARLDKENIVIVTRGEHNALHSYTWQQLIDIDINFDIVYQKYLNLKSKYAER
jgi:hypothetical protein